jgi:uncharacterized protein (TIGR02118 family)
VALLTVIYRTPKDAAAFDEHYFETHIPLAKQIPGLRKYEVSQGPISSVAGGGDFHLVANLYFDDMAAIQSAFASPEGQAAGADRLVFAPDDADVIMLLFETREV